MKKINGMILFVVLGMARVAFAADAQEAANPAANEKTKAILKYVQSLDPQAAKHLISGQFINSQDPSDVRLMDKIHDKTGYWPALLGVDYASQGGINIGPPNRAAIAYWREGGLVTVSTHLYDPMNFQGGGLRDQGVDLSILLDESSAMNRRWIQELDRVAEGLQQLKDAGVVVLWRPFHEMNGGWFWWGGKDPNAFIKLWRHMFDYFSRTKNLDNLLWVYSPNHGEKTTAYYPGDRYVDLVGLDAYSDFIDLDHIQGYPPVARLPKPFGFTEYGPHGPSNPPGDYDYLQFVDGLEKNFPRAVFFMCWNEKWSLAANKNAKELLARPEIINREDLPKGLIGEQ
jgi:mannan endo-1,4-beta-mannosidase